MNIDTKTKTIEVKVKT